MFRVQKAEETETRTYRIPISLFDKLSKTAQNENVSVYNLIIQCCTYALEHLDNSSFNVTPKSKKTGK